MHPSLLQNISQPRDLKRLSSAQIQQLCGEIRQFLLDSVSKTGGHLASNLGAVELTVALHRIFETPRDAFVFDVGHQCYTHKLLTGRREGFAHLRQVDGLSGFPSPQESDCDTFIAGHGSTALSTAIGVARAKKLKKEPGKVVAIIGDGAFTGGMVYEGMNNVSNLNNLIVVLNDNKMSISKNVGQMANYLTKLRTDPKYFRVKAHMETALGCIPAVGTALVEVLQEGKKIIRRGIYHSTMFEEMGFQYVGPVDGHDVTELTRIFTNLQEQYSPVFLHIVTQKGKGLKPAEENPGEFHSVSAFDLDHLTNPEMSPKDSFSNRFGNKLAALGREVPNLCAITAAMKYGTGLNFFYRAIPERFFDVGMAEEHAVTFAAGLAAGGLKPVVAVYSSFLQRAYDQVLHDVCIQNLHVIFAVDRAGLVGSDGETHQGIFDLSYLSLIPNMCVMAPKNKWELSDMLKFAISSDGPIALRYPRGEAYDGLSEHRAKIVYGKSELLYDEECIALIAVGSMVKTAHEVRQNLKRKGFECTLINARFVKPLDEERLLALTKEHKLIVTLEENVLEGGFGEHVSEFYEEIGSDVQVMNIALPDAYIEHGNVEILKKECGIDAETIEKKIIAAAMGL